MVDPRVKGAKAETVIRDQLRKITKLQWERTPGSGALHEKHQLKGDIYVVGENNAYCVECKHYKDDYINSGILTHKLPQVVEWWQQAVRQGKQVNKKPLLIFKHDRSKLFVAYSDIPSFTCSTITINIQPNEFFISLLEDWIKTEEPEFIK